ncbi:hypothetical protein C5O27_16415 [Gordonia alkanivorans]|uniref:LGFP repeat-containing protein n=1 Tax=Gordonia alkanivorans TaxID=84096 RepID=UPI000FDE56CA|nr:hypothetical protein [Gordonia alkanivorans]AZZ82441.1 hypothetical protein C5O27_16415 [Gordonia alkanivorans]
MTRVALRLANLAAGMFVVALIAAGCGGADANDTSSKASSAEASVSPSDADDRTVAETSTPGTPATVTITGVDDVAVTLVGPLAVKYAAATDAQKRAIGIPLTGDHNAGTRDSGVVYQQFQRGVIIAKNANPGTPAYIVTSGKIRDAWNTERAPDGVPLLTGKNGSAGPLGVPTSDVTTDGDLEVATFEYGTISENTAAGDVIVTVNGKVVPSGLK